MRQHAALAVTLVLAAAIAGVVRADGETAYDFRCQLCHAATQLLASAPPRSITTEARLRSQVCENRALFRDPCADLLPGLRRHAAAAGRRAFDDAHPMDAAALAHIAAEASTAAGREHVCRGAELCPRDEVHERLLRRLAEYPSGSNAAAVDMKVGLASASRGEYAAVRVSVTDNGPKFNATNVAVDSDLFDYTAPFRYFWTEKTLHTAVRPLTEQTTGLNGAARVAGSIPMGGALGNVSVSLPAKGKGFKLLVVADPCWSSRWVTCPYGEHLQIFERLTGMLNLSLARDIDGWVLIGDNFYDPHALLAPGFMAALSLEAKSKPLLTLPGNHDFWQWGAPWVPSLFSYDQFGFGWIQYWGQDSVAAARATAANRSATPFDFGGGPHGKTLAPASNFFVYNMLGNVVFISFSGAHTFNETQPLLDEACAFVEREDPAYVIVLGHWSEVNLGCQPGMDTKSVHDYVANQSPGCKRLGAQKRVKWFEGHAHCNVIVEPDTGFRVAGFGMVGCENLGFPLLEVSDDGDMTVSYFPIVGGNGSVPVSDEGKPAPNGEDHSYESLAACVAANGLSGCKHMAVTWLSQPGAPSRH